MAGSSRRITYQAQVTLPATIARIQAAYDLILRAGGQLEFLATATPGLTIVRLSLPEDIPPEALLPGIPFFPL